MEISSIVYLEWWSRSFFSAVKGGKEDCVAILLENHADINTIGAVSVFKKMIGFSFEYFNLIG